MALIGKIREKSWLLLIVVGGAIVVFIFTSQGPNFGGGPEEEYGIGLIYGEKVDQQAYNQLVNEKEEIAIQNAERSGQPKQPVNQDDVWREFIEEKILEKEYEALGINVSENEFDAYLYGRNGFAPPSDLQNAFKDEAGNFDPKALEQQIEQLKGSDDPEMKKAWERSKEFYMAQRKRQKYYDILDQGIYVTSLEAKQEYVAANEKKSISFVVLNYGSIPDSDIKVDDKKLKAYFNKHKNEAKYINRVSSRVVRWSEITIEPSKKDIVDFNEEIETLKNKLTKTKKDSLFVMSEADSKVFSTKLGYRPEGSQNQMASQGFVYPIAMDSTFRNSKVGDVIGPYQQNGATKVAKVVSKGSLFSVRHILIGGNRADSLAVAKAQKTTDSLMLLINKDNFEQYVTDFSTDQGSLEKGGKYENFISNEMVPEFEEFAKTQPIGKIGYVQTDFGFHIMEVLDREENVVPNLAVIDRTLNPGAETLIALEKDSYDLLSKMYKKLDATKNDYRKVALFDTIASRKDMFVRSLTIQDENPKITGFSSAYAENELFKLAFNKEAKVGDLISSPLKDGERWVVAILADIRIEDKATFENAKATVKSEYIKEQKALKLMSKMRGKSLEAIATNENVSIIPAEVTFAQSTLGKIASEPKIVGALFSGLKDGKMTQPLKGNAGVYVVRVEKTSRAPQTADYSKEKDQLLGSRRSSVGSSALAGLKEMAEVVDNRKFYEINLRR